MKRKTNGPFAYLIAGTILFALGPAVLKLMTTMGGRFGLEAPHAVSFCNVLFIGNLCAGLMMIAAYGARPLTSELRALHRGTRLALAASAILSTVYPALIFTALEHTSVINVVLLSRFNGIVFVALAFLLYRTRVRRADIIGYTIIALGVLVLVGVQNMGDGLGTGEALVLVAALFFALTEFVSKRVLQEASVELYVFVRNMASAFLFFTVAVYFFGWHHFMEAFQGELWILMVAYAGLAVVAAQLLWLRATRVLPVARVAKVQLINPFFSILFAYLLLSEVPSSSEWLVMGIVLVGMLFPVLAERGYHNHRPRSVAVSYTASMVGTH